jgi:hypothetical protein
LYQFFLVLNFFLFLCRFIRGARACGQQAAALLVVQELKVLFFSSFKFLAYFLHVFSSGGLSLVREHGQQAAASWAAQRLELSAMQAFAHSELARQDAAMTSTRQQCLIDMRAIVSDMNKVLTWEK